jgi:FG-GAP repeat
MLDQALACIVDTAMVSATATLDSDDSVAEVPSDSSTNDSEDVPVSTLDLPAILGAFPSMIQENEASLVAMVADPPHKEDEASHPNTLNDSVDQDQPVVTDSLAILGARVGTSKLMHADETGRNGASLVITGLASNDSEGKVILPNESEPIPPEWSIVQAWINKRRKQYEQQQQPRAASLLQPRRPDTDDDVDIDDEWSPSKPRRGLSELATQSCWQDAALLPPLHPSEDKLQMPATPVPLIPGLSYISDDNHSIRSDQTPIASNLVSPRRGRLITESPPQAALDMERSTPKQSPESSPSTSAPATPITPPPNRLSTLYRDLHQHLFDGSPCCPKPRSDDDDDDDVDEEEATSATTPDPALANESETACWPFREAYPGRSCPYADADPEIHSVRKCPHCRKHKSWPNYDPGSPSADTLATTDTSFSFRGTRLFKPRWRARRCLVLSALVVTVLVVIVATSVTMTNRDHDHDDDDDKPEEITLEQPQTDRPSRAPVPLAATPSPTAEVTPQTVATTVPTAAPTTAWNALSLNVATTLVEPQAYAFGAAIVLSRQGQVLAVGAPESSVQGQRRAGRVSVFERQYFSDNDGGSMTWVPREQGDEDDEMIGRNRTRTELMGRGRGDLFGSALGLSADGSLLVVGAPANDDNGNRSGRVHTFWWNDRTNRYQEWNQALRGAAPGSFFGASLAISANGDYLVVGAPYFGNDQQLGQVRVYQKVRRQNESRWSQMGPSLWGNSTGDMLGWSVDISDDGLVIVASAPRNARAKGYVQAWEWNMERDGWDQLAAPVINEVNATRRDSFGYSVSLASIDRPLATMDQNTGGSFTNTRAVYRLAIGSPHKTIHNRTRAGAVLVYQLDLADKPTLSPFPEASNFTWKRVGKVLASDDPSTSDQLGCNVDLLDNGSLVVAGTRGSLENSGSARLYFVDENARWYEYPTVWSGNEEGDNLGVAVSVARTATASDGESNATASLIVALGASSTVRGGRGYVKAYEGILPDTLFPNSP